MLLLQCLSQHADVKLQLHCSSQSSETLQRQHAAANLFASDSWDLQVIHVDLLSTYSVPGPAEWSASTSSYSSHCMPLWALMR